MSPAQIALLGAIAGVTIFIGLPVGQLRAIGPSGRAFMSSVAVGILLFLFWHVLTAAAEPIEDALKAAVPANAGGMSS